MLPGKSRMSRSSMSIAAVWTFLPDSQRDTVFAPTLSRRRNLLAVDWKAQPAAPFQHHGPALRTSIIRQDAPAAHPGSPPATQCPHRCP